jgi:hypothetical protein
MDQWRHYKEDLSSAFEKPMEIHIREPAQQNWNHIRGPGKNSAKISNIFTFTAEKMALAIGQQWSIVKNPETDRDPYLGLGLSIYIKKVLSFWWPSPFKCALSLPCTVIENIIYRMQSRNLPDKNFPHCATVWGEKLYSRTPSPQHTTKSYIFEDTVRAQNNSNCCCIH